MVKQAMMVSMVAIAYGTTVGPSGTIIHTDPEGLDPRAVNPEVDERDVQHVIEKGLAELPKADAKRAPKAPPKPPKN